MPTRRPVALRPARVPRALLLPLAALAAGIASSPAARGQTYPAQIYEERDGLPSGVVCDIAQESNGRMWFTTRVGVVSFDGREWRVEQPVTPSGGPLTRLAIDGQDHVWASTHRLDAGVLNRPAGGSWSSIPPPEGAKQAEIVELLAQGGEAGDRLIVATRQHGLYELWPEGWRASAPPRDPQSDPDGPAPQIVDAEVQGQRLLLATDDGLWIRTGASWQRAALETPSRSLWSLAAAGSDERDPVWLTGRDWLGLLDGERFTLELEHHQVFSAASGPYSEYAGALPAVADGARGLWFGHLNKLAHFDRESGTLQSQGISNGLAANGANALYRDLDDNVWIATNRGLTRVSSLRFTNYDRSGGLLADEVCALLESPPGRIVFGHPGGLSFLDLATGTISTRGLPLSADEAETTPVLDLAADPQGNLWLAAAQLGLARLTPAGELTTFGKGSLHAQSVCCDPTGRIWVGSTAGLFQLSGEALVPQETPFGPRGVRRVLPAGAGTLGLCTAGAGAWIRRADGWTQLEGRDPDTARQAYAVHRDRDGRLLVGALDGLFAEEGGVLVPIALGEQALREPIYSIRVDAEGREWFGTQRGVVSWDGREARRYGVQQGLAGLETNRAASLLDSTGAMWFGTVEGASRYARSNDRDADRPLAVELLGLDVHGLPRPVEQDLVLGPELDDPVFHFRAISFLGTGEVEYRCRLAGFEDDWVAGADIGAGIARYTNLPAGSYRFIAQARSPGGRWGPAAQSGRIRIEPPFWLSGWFLALAAMLFGTLGFSLWRLRLELHKARALERQVEQRTAELLRAQKLESLGLLAGGVAHDFNNLLTAVMAHCELAASEGAPVQSHLEGIGRAAERGAALTRALLGYARRQETSPRALSLNESIDGMQALLRPLVRSEIELRIELAPDVASVYLDPSQLEQVLMNLVVNAIDAMPAGGVLTIATEQVHLGAPLAIAHGESVPAGDWVRLSVSDTGIGMDADAQARLFDPFYTTKAGGRGTGLGLSTSHGSVKQSGGFIDFASTEGRGTTFCVYFPASAARPEAAPAPTAAPSAVGLDGACVLVAEDDPMVRPLLVQALAQAGCRTLVAADGEQALRLAAEHAGPIDLLISDVIMPGLSGPELRAHLLRERPGLRVLFVSGYTADALSGLEHALAPFELLHKPFSVEELIARATRVLAAADPAAAPLSRPAAARSGSRSPA